MAVKKKRPEPRKTGIAGVTAAWSQPTAPGTGVAMPQLTLSQADAIADAALAEAVAHGAKPCAIALVDPGGNILVLKRHEEAGFAYVDFVTAKARAAVSIRRGVKSSGKALAERGILGSITTLMGGNFLPIAGSVLIRDRRGRIVGGLGIAGPSGGESDEACALAALHRYGFTGEV